MEKIKFLTDENFRRAILDGVLARLPDLDILRVQDAGLRTYSDPKILEVAALENRILLTHDVRTLETHARARIAKSKPMPGVMIIREQVPIGKAIEGIILIAECDHPEEWNGIIRTRPRHPTRSFSHYILRLLTHGDCFVQILSYTCARVPTQPKGLIVAGAQNQWQIDNKQKVIHHNLPIPNRTALIATYDL